MTEKKIAKTEAPAQTTGSGSPENESQNRSAKNTKAKTGHS
jgi:hypothetical protein